MISPDKQFIVSTMASFQILNYSNHINCKNAFTPEITIIDLLQSLIPCHLGWLNDA